ncbi:flagellar hook-associated protein FlgK [Arthrobacter crystallopoietes BAB-32]|uniref:Flagellar hook-associated protein 1 n=1 Tax=Arthrobacter crystallopoietes BAB-32 TaxID=1246476 RepID=N1V1X5_9MICC|nr:flagellar hook-associated protein FlgK [Arthrobacter crystallopoietes]EMY34087.1 flagellar hook-associated protein FlgK [Arthrobacter crystallopoietes BAB-32]
MSSTFGSLSTALTGLNAARQGSAVTGQNVANAGTEGYTRQRIQTSAIGATAQTGLFAGGPTAGQGVSIDAISRLGDSFLDTRVRATASDAGYAAARAEALLKLEDIMQEPGENGLSAKLQDVWAAWQNVANDAGEAAPASVLLEEAGALAAQLSHGYAQIEAQWSAGRTQLDSLAEELNAAAAQVAELNGEIRSALNAGSPANELMDKRNLLTASIASLAGGEVRDAGDGTLEILIGGNAIVSADSFRPVQLTGGYRMQDAAAAPVQLEWAHRPGSPIALAGGTIAGALSVLAPAATNGAGGEVAEAAASYNAFAGQLATAVNSVHRTGQTPAGTTGHDFFAFRPQLPPALGLTIVPADISGIAAGAPGSGGRDGSVADAISQIGVAAGSPDGVWASFVTKLAVTARTDIQRSELAAAANASAVNMQLSSASVDLDEESVNLLTYQHAYQANARVMTAIDEMLNVLINQTGLVGR